MDCKGGARDQKHYTIININEIAIIFKPMYLIWKQVEQWACKVSTCGHTLAANTKKLQFFLHKPGETCHDEKVEP